MDNCTAGAVGGAASWSRSGPRWSATSLSCSALPPTWPTFANRWPVSTSATPGALRSQAAPAGTLRDQVSCRPARGVAAPRCASVGESQSQGHMLRRIVWKKSHLGSALEQFPGFRPRRTQPAQRGAHRLAAAQPAKPAAHEAGQAPQRPARLRVSPGYGWAGGLPLHGKNFLADSRRTVWAKGGAATGAPVE